MRVVTPRTRTPSNEVRAAVVDAAMELLREDGPGALTVRRIASRAGVAPMAVYNHFDGKDGVVEELFIRGFDRLGEVFDDIRSDDPLEDLAEAGRRYRRLALTDPALYSVMFERSVTDYQPSPRAKQHAAAAFAVLVGQVQRAMDAGVLTPDDPERVGQRLWNACHGQVSLELRGMGFVDDLDRHADELSATILRGLRAG